MNYIFNDILVAHSVWFQNSATKMAILIVEVHNVIWYFATFIAVFVAWILVLAIIDGKISDGSTYRDGLVTFSTISLSCGYPRKHRPTSLRFMHGDLLEFLWLIGPCIILIIIAIPSFCLLLEMDSANHIEPHYILSVIGNQWYWVYQIDAVEYVTRDPVNFYHVASNFENKTETFLMMKTTTDIAAMDTTEFLMLYPYAKHLLVHLHNFNAQNPEILYEQRSAFKIGAYDSYMLSTDDLNFGGYRLLEVDYPVGLIEHTPYMCYITSHDVLHSWAVPSLGIKVDAVPGRINTVGFEVLRNGIYYGQCSELCGVNHGFMPIAVIVVPDYFKYAAEFCSEQTLIFYYWYKEYGQVENIDDVVLNLSEGSISEEFKNLGILNIFNYFNK